jgi:hypothetical protein
MATGPPADTLAGASPLKVGTLQFRNNFALTKKATQMPGGSFTLEMWARGAAVGDEATAQRRTNLLSYATEALGQGETSPSGWEGCAFSQRTALLLSGSASDGFSNTCIRRPCDMAFTRHAVCVYLYGLHAEH